jgi:nucleoside-diphosphate-sugar epimerase
MKTLFIGGTGIISSACSSLAIEKGMELYHLNRGKTKSIRHIEGVKQIEADIRNIELVEQALKDYNFDVVVDFLCFTPEQMLDSINLFKGRCKQFVFISSASAYEKPPHQLPIAEYTPLNNPYWQYSQDKKACEKLLKKSTENIDLSYTIVRPSHTYDKTLIPLIGGYTTLHRMIQGKPVVIHGDGSSVWTMTHHRDFAV